MPGQVKWAMSFAVGAGFIALGWRVPVVLSIVHVLLCFLLIIVVLLQSGKAADLAGAFGGAGSQTAFGPRGAATFLSKATTWCAIMFMITSIAVGLRQTTRMPQGSSVLEKFSKPVPQEQSAPPAPAPQQQTPPPAPQQSAPQTPPAQPPAKP